MVPMASRTSFGWMPVTLLTSWMLIMVPRPACSTSRIARIQYDLYDTCARPGARVGAGARAARSRDNPPPRACAPNSATRCPSTRAKVYTREQAVATLPYRD